LGTYFKYLRGFKNGQGELGTVEGTY